MKTKKSLAVIIALALAAVLGLSGCTSAANAQDLMQGIQAAQWPETPAAMDGALKASLTQFSMDLFASCLEEEGNVLCSPASVYLALAMTMNGAQRDTLAAMGECLSADGLAQQDLNTACRDYIGLLRTETEKTQVSVANSIWFREGYPVSTEFLQTNGDYFGAGARALDFNAPEAVEAINAWVRAQTQDKIDGIVEEIDPLTVMFLINAVYFRSDWSTPFDANDTSAGQFASPSGSVAVDYMHRNADMLCVQADGVQGVMLPYDDGRFSFFALLPPEGTEARDFAQGLDGASLARLLESMESRSVYLALPRFEIEYKNSLKDELSAMGMSIAFTDTADLSRIHSEGVDELYVADVMHKTYCRVDEKGTEAAAATSVEIRLETALMHEVEMRFDRPFLFGIVDSASGTPVFLGLLQTPGA